MNNPYRLRIGDFVRHFKHTDNKPCLYQILNFAEHSETGERLVVYESLANGNVYARPYDMFMSEVDRDKYPDVNQKYRFEKVN